MLQVNVMSPGRIDLDKKENCSFSFMFDDERFFTESETDQPDQALSQLWGIVYRWQLAGKINTSDNNTITADQYIVILRLFQEAGFGSHFLPFAGVKQVAEMSCISHAARSLGGSKSKAKAAAARENGRKGGRPKKPSSSVE